MRTALPRLVATYVALLLLLLGTVGASFLRLGPWNPVVALVIAVAKAGLIVAVFMELAEGEAVVSIVAAAALFWLGILFVLAGNDFLTRGTPIG